MSKLVRDKIPDIIRARGGRPVTRIADDSEYLARLTEKLAEEADELRDADDSHRAEELADVLEVVLAIADHDGLTRDDLEKMRQAKAAERGGFGGRIIWSGNELERGELPVITQTAPDTLDAMTLTDALSQAWLSIRKDVPDVPDATIGVGRGPLHVTDWDTPVVLVPPSTVAMGGLMILEFLLHQAAHSLDRVAYAGAAGRYHGEGYRAAAGRLGLDVDKAPGLGWARTSITPKLAEVYAEQITSLDSARRGFEDPGPRQHSRRITVQCACPRNLSVVPSVFHRGGVVCEICGQPFREPEHVTERG